ncbi:hypothetical protein U9K47_15785 [Bacillus toyonensis]|uniref:hypothetical protein n=1 Tax=Bacillus toyonensis TaxID=155322 RepID=UPI003466FCBE
MWFHCYTAPYYYDDKGVKKTRWKEIGGKWFYFKDSGEATIGWFYGSYETTTHGYGYFWYYGKANGSIYQNVTAKLYDSQGFEKEYTFDSHGHKK